MPTDAPQIRRARGEDADEVAALLRRVREQNRGTIPPGVHPLSAMVVWARETLIPQYDVWVADRGGVIVAVLVLGRPDWIEHLYVDASATGQGLGARFVELAKTELGGAIQLWTFQRNEGARRFYERHGFEAVQETDGDNEEGEPDVRYLFAPAGVAPC